MSISQTYCYRALFFFFLILPFFSAGQLNADFSSDKTGGCAPLNISFTNRTTGASANATYHWDFGNGNISSIQNPGAVFNNETSYTVTLTVKDGTQISVKARTITVYKRPAVDFTFSPDNGCLPMPVTFTSTSTAGNGTITSYSWDFGDGIIQQSFFGTTTHTYTFEQTATVRLTATNEYGCANTITKQNIIKVHPEIKVGFAADKTIECFAPATISFSNTSTGPGTLTYLWDFGDGNTSTQATPSHTYTRKGTYTVKLTVNSSEGCSKTETKSAYINVEDFVTDFQVPSPICTDRYATFTPVSSPMPNQSHWIINGMTHFVFNGGTPFTNYFVSEGTYTLELINSFGGCQQGITKQIEVKKTPALNGFVADIVGLCGAPSQVNFKDTSSSAVAWKWNFDSYNNSTIGSTQKNPSFTYSYDNNFRVQLTITDAAGCTNSVYQTVGISKPLSGIFLAPGNNYGGCAPFTTQFEYRATESLASFQWNFGDGKTSTDVSPVHTFTQPGDYTVTFTYTTTTGCTGTLAYSQPIKAFQKPVANFTVDPLACGNNFVTFNNTTTGGPYSYTHWDFGDGSGWVYATNKHQYQEEGEYTVKLMVNTFFYECGDTITKTAIIKVIPPFARIGSVQNTCNDTRGLVTFEDASRKATGWHWDFGDGKTMSYTTPPSTISHLYTTSGQYKVVLTVTNGTCSVKDSTIVHVLLKNQPLLSFGSSEVCINQWLEYNVTNLNLNPHNYFTYWQPYGVVAFVYEDGTQVPGIIGYDGTAGTNVSGKWRPETIKEGRVRAILRSTVFDCYDTTNYVNLKIKGSYAGFEIVTDDICFKSPVILRDTSKTSPGHTINSWEWSFGDGVVQTFSQGGIINHVYANPGYYNVNLKITDAAGCTAYSNFSRYVQVSGPKAAFSSSAGNNVQLNTTITFYNYSNTYNSPNTTWKWDFGNGATSTEYSPSYTYTVPGDYLVVLIAENPQTGCKDTTSQFITVKNFNTGFTKNVSFIGSYGQCPPVLANFYNTSVNYTRLVWDFGDGTILENQYAPSHIYNKTGKYIITLQVYGYNGLTGTYQDSIIVGEPIVTINADDLDGCIGHKVLLNTPIHTGAVSYTWDFGNGYLVNNTDSFATAQFLNAGSYAASVIVKDENGCRSLVSLADKIVIYPDPIVTIQPAAPVVCKENAITLHASGGVSYVWSPANGLNNPAIASPTAFPSTTTTYRVEATDANGCTNDTSVLVTVAQPFAMTAKPEYDICAGTTVKLNGSGAHAYQWINTTSGLSNTAIPDPIASPSTTTLYTIVGYDQYNCYSDTIDVLVNVRPLPTVNAGPDRDVYMGSENTLNITTSSDVTKWVWTPSDFLSCTNCPAPVTKPYAPVSYIITVSTSYGCSAKDTIKINALCAGGGIYIPSAFTPNNDGKNDVFGISGTGVGLVRSFRIYNRWGEIVFERKNFYPNDRNGSWNGKQKGLDAPTGTYVYFAEMECDAGEVFERKGTVTLIR